VQTHFRQTNPVRSTLLSFESVVVKLKVKEETAGLNARSKQAAKTSKFDGFTTVTAADCNVAKEERVENNVGVSASFKTTFAATVTSNIGVNWFESAEGT
jgi:hypothetical protein